MKLRPPDNYTAHDAPCGIAGCKALTCLEAENRDLRAALQRRGCEWGEGDDGPRCAVWVEKQRLPERCATCRALERGVQERTEDSG